MFGFHALMLPRELTREDLPRVIRPFWARSRLRDAWSSSGSHYRLLDAYERLEGFSPRYDEHALLRVLEQAVEGGRLIMLDWEEVTFDPVASGRGDSIKLHSPGPGEPLGFTLSLEQALQRRRGGARRQQQAETAAPSSRPLTFEESVAVNKKYFGQPVSEQKALPVTGAAMPDKNPVGIATAESAQLPSENGQKAEPAFHIVRRPIGRSELIEQLYGSIAAKPESFDRLNPQLPASLLPGEMIVLGDPLGVFCSREEYDLMAVAERVNAQVRQLSEEEAQFITEYYDLLEFMTSNAQVGLGVGAVMIEKQVAGIQSTLREIEKLHQESYRKYGNLNNRDFFTKRGELLKRLDFALGSVARKGLSLNDNPKLKRALGVSTKSLIHSWKQAGVSNLPGYSSRYDQLARWAKYVKNGGHMAIALDIGISGARIKEACTSEDSKNCEVVAYKESGRVLGSAGGGFVGSQAALGCGFLGLTTGVGGLVCVILVGGTGAAAGGYAGGKGGEAMGEKVRGVFSSD